MYRVFEARKNRVCYRPSGPCKNYLKHKNFNSKLIRKILFAFVCDGKFTRLEDIAYADTTMDNTVCAILLTDHELELLNSYLKDYTMTATTLINALLNYAVSGKTEYLYKSMLEYAPKRSIEGFLPASKIVSLGEFTEGKGTRGQRTSRTVTRVPKTVPGIASEKYVQTEKSKVMESSQHVASNNITEDIATKKNVYKPAEKDMENKVEEASISFDKDAAVASFDSDITTKDVQITGKAGSLIRIGRNRK